MNAGTAIHGVTGGHGAAAGIGARRDFELDAGSACNAAAHVVASREQVARECVKFARDFASNKPLLSKLGSHLSLGAKAYLDESRTSIKKFLQQHADRFQLTGSGPELRVELARQSAGDVLGDAEDAGDSDSTAEGPPSVSVPWTYADEDLSLDATRHARLVDKCRDLVGTLRQAAGEEPDEQRQDVLQELAFMSQGLLTSLQQGPVDKKVGQSAAQLLCRIEAQADAGVHERAQLKMPRIQARDAFVLACTGGLSEAELREKGLASRLTARFVDMLGREPEGELLSQLGNAKVKLFPPGCARRCGGVVTAAATKPVALPPHLRPPGLPEPLRWPEAPAPACVVPEGCRVLAKYGETWLPGRFVRRLDDGFVEVWWESEYSRSRSPLTDVVPFREGVDLVAGMQVLAPYGGAWHPASILALGGSDVEVRWRSEYSRSTVRRSDVVPLAAGQAVK